MHPRRNSSISEVLQNPFRLYFREIKTFGNPFIIGYEECELLELDARDVMGPNIVKSINEIEREGKEQADHFMKERLGAKAKDIEVLEKRPFCRSGLK